VIFWGWEKGRQGVGSSSFFEKKEPKKLLSVWLRSAAARGSLRPEIAFGARSRWLAVAGVPTTRMQGEKSFFGSFFSKKELLPSCHLPSLVREKARA
jgi:hypothetical protein